MSASAVRTLHRYILCLHLSVYTRFMYTGRARLRESYDFMLTDIPTSAAMVWAILRGVDDRDWIRRQDDGAAVAGAHATGTKRNRSTAFGESNKRKL